MFFFFSMENFSPFLWTIVWNIVISLWIVLIVFLSKTIKNKLNSYLEYITAITVWILLWIIFLWFIPELSTNLSWKYVWISILFWVFLFYLLELFLHWHHCKDLNHKHDCHSHHDHEHKNGFLMFGWTFLHNAFHWIVLFWAFSIDLKFWIATTFAILLHSIPQNIVNYIMNHKDIKFAYIASFWWIIWAFLTYPFYHFLLDNKFYILWIISWWLLYTSLTDILPEFRWNLDTSKKLRYLIFIIIWVLAFFCFETFVEYINNNWLDLHD